MRKSKTIEIYKRFGLKFALAYSTKKKRVKFQNSFPHLVMLYFFLKTPSKLKMYKILRKYNIITINPKSLDFVITYYNEILQWLNSKEFQEQYIQTKHPYPPMLNPQKLNAKIQNIESKENELQDKDIQFIEPYPNLSYETIPADIAWDLNLPLPRGYKSIWAVFGLSGSAAITSFLDKMGVSVLRIGGSFDNSYKRAYNFLQKRNFEMFIWDSYIDMQQSYSDKLLSLIDAPVPVLINVRDSIGRLKTGVNHGWYKTKKAEHSLYTLDDSTNLLVDRIIYEDNKDKPHLDILGNFNNFYITYCSPSIWSYDKVISMLPSAKCIQYIDIQEITGERTFETMTNLAKAFGFSAPKDEDRTFFTKKIYNQYAQLLPITIQVSNTIEIFVQQQIHAPRDKVDISSKLSLDSLGLQIGFFVSKEGEIELFNDETLTNKVVNKLQEYIKLLEAKTKSVEANKVTERQVLEYFKENLNLMKIYKTYFDENFTHLKANRPDIIESWKYFKEFERIYENGVKGET